MSRLFGDNLGDIKRKIPIQDDRKSSEAQRWKGDVRRRDGNACRVCGVQRNIHVHHIKPFKKYPDFATDIDNGITLCGNCHTLFRGKEESTNLQTITEAVTGQPHLRTTDQLKRLNGKFCAYLEPLLKSSDPNTRNNAIYQLLIHLQIYPDSLDQFLSLIRHLLNQENSRFDQGLVAQMVVEYLKGSSSNAALKVLREYEKRIEAEEEERSELFPWARQGDAEDQSRLGMRYQNGKSSERQMSARDRRELAIMQSNDHHPLNKASADQLAKLGTLPPSSLYALVLIQYGLDQQAMKAGVTSSLHQAIEEQVQVLDKWTPKRTMRFLTHYLEDDYPTEAAPLVRQAETPLGAAQELIEIVRVNLIATGIEIAPDRPWA